MVNLYRDPEGKHVLSRSKSSVTESNGPISKILGTKEEKSSRSLGPSHNDSVIMLRARIRELEGQLDISEVPAKVSLFN